MERIWRLRIKMVERIFISNGNQLNIYELKDSLNPLQSADYVAQGMNAALCSQGLNNSDIQKGIKEIFRQD